MNFSWGNSFLGLRDIFILWLTLINPLEALKFYRYLRFTPWRRQDLKDMIKDNVNEKAKLALWQSLNDLLEQTVVSARITFNVIDPNVILSNVQKPYNAQPQWGPLRMRRPKGTTRKYFLKVSVSDINGETVVLQTERFCERTLRGGRTNPHEVTHKWLQNFFANVRVTKKEVSQTFVITVDGYTPETRFREKLLRSLLGPNGLIPAPTC
jgi:hypothetical protein